MSEQMRILEKIESGEICVAEGARLLGSSGGSAGPVEGSRERPGWANVVQQVAFWIGLALLVGGATLVASFYIGWLARGWQVAGWVLFVLGVLGLVMAWWLQRAAWLSVRVQSHDGDNVSIDLPLPLGAAELGVRLCAPFVPELRESGVSEVISVAREGLRQGEPLVIEVDDAEDGDHVRVSIG